MNMTKTLYWKNNRLYILDQLLLPHSIRYICCLNHRDVYRAIKTMAIRGAPAIGVAAAFGIALAAQEKKFKSLDDLKRHIKKSSAYLFSSRPTAVNLSWALERMGALLDGKHTDANALSKCIVAEAKRVYEEDIIINRAIGDNGAELLKKGSIVMTHCNAGALATAGYGTALGVIRSAHSQSKINHVFVDETRPYLQGARLTAWELLQEKIPYTLITDNMSGHIMKTCKVNAVIVGADRIASNGDTANKIGTYALSILAAHHGIKFYIAAPTSTIDWRIASGDEITIEERSAREVLYVGKKLIAPAKSAVRHPAFDVTPAKLITAIITEKGIFKPGELKNIL